MPKKLKKTSIIVVAYDTIRLQRFITSACIGNISRYTDKEDYELIFVDQCYTDNLNNRFHNIDPDITIRPTENIGASAASNLGASKATGDYLCFIHNDVLVWEDWLPTLRGFLERGDCDIIYPHQGANTRAQVKEFYAAENPRGNDDAGLTMMTREAWEKTGGWNEDFKTVYMDAAFRYRFPSQPMCTANCLITHICAGTIWAWSEEDERAAYDEEGPLFNTLRDKPNKKNYICNAQS